MAMYDQIYKRIDDNLWKDSGCGSELDYAEQSSWILFLKYLDDLEESREAAAELDGRAYTPILEKKYRWSTWAVPKKNGEKDLSKTLTGDDLLNFVRNKLFPYLRAFKTSDAAPDSIQYKIGEIFSGIQCKLTSGYVMRDVFDEVDDLAEFRKLFKKKSDSANSWTVNIADLDPETLDLTVRNPNAVEMRQAILREAFEGRL